MCLRNRCLKYIIPFLFGSCLLGWPSKLLAQENRKAEQAKSEKTSQASSALEDQASNEVLDTEETLKYFGGRLSYQLKKRLHLTDEEDDKNEKQEQEKAKSAKFSVFGITIEKH